MFVSPLRAAGTDRHAFNEALAALKAAKLSAPVVATIARDYADTVTTYRSKAAAYDDIVRAFIRRSLVRPKDRRVICTAAPEKPAQ